MVKKVTMDDGTECFVSGCLGKVLRLARFVGVAPLNFEKKNTGWRVRLSRNWSIYGNLYISIIGLLALSGLVADFCVEQSKPGNMHNKRRRIIWHVEFLFTIMIAVTAVFGAPGRMRSIIACLDHTEKIHREFKVCKLLISERDEQRKFCFVIIWAIVTVTLACIDCGLLISTNFIDEIGAERWINVLFMSIYFCSWTNKVQIMLFALTTVHVAHSFKAVNDSLLHIYNDIVPPGIKYDIKMRPLIAPFQLSPRTKKHKLFKNDAQAIARSEINTDSPIHHQHDETIHSVAQVYLSSCDMVREVDRCHGLLLLMMLMSLLLQLVVSTYNLIHQMLDNNVSIIVSLQLGNIAVQIFWCIYHTACLMIIIEPSHITIMEMEMTREMVSRLMYCAHSVYEPLAVELALFSRHLMLNQVSYSPMKVTTLTRSLIVTIFGSITTYVAVLIDL